MAETQTLPPQHQDRQPGRQRQLRPQPQTESKTLGSDRHPQKALTAKRRTSARNITRKTSTREGTPKKSTRKATRKKSARKYGTKARKKVKRSMHEVKRGKLKSGRSGKRVKSRKQAIAIGLSEARRRLA